MSHNAYSSPMTDLQSRRSFIKSAGFAGAASVGALATVGSALADEPAAGSSSSGGASSDTTWDEEFDFVIIGAGIAGASAAVTVATEGDGATCLLAEKMETPMGNTPYSDGSVLFGYDADAFYAYMKEMAGEHATTPDDVLRVYSDAACQLKEWIFDDLGADWETSGTSEPTTAEDFADNASTEYPEYEHSYSVGKIRIGKGEGAPEDGPKHIIQFLNGLIEQYADVIDFRCDFPMTELIRNWETGRVEGAVIGGKNIKANKGVIMCCGGFETDPVMMENYLGAGSAVPGAGVGNTGDGHRACMKIGADFWHMEHVAGFWMVGRDLENTKSTNLPTGKSGKKYGITVGVSGRRYYMDVDSFREALNTEYLGDIRLSVGSRHGHANLGGDWPHAQQPRKAWFIFDQAGLEAGAISPDYSTDPVADGLAYSADTIEALAEMIDVPTDELVSTVEVWNGFCADGHDAAFFRPADTLTPISTPPFYAQLCAPAFLNTDGGPVRNAKGEILDPDGNPIPGLYSAGEFGSIWCGGYNGGGNLTEGLVFGRIAVQSALAQA